MLPNTTPIIIDKDTKVFKWKWTSWSFSILSPTQWAIYVADIFNPIKTKIKDNVFIGSNSSLVAPLTLEEGSVIGAGSVITKNVSKRSLALTRSAQTQIKNYKRKSK